MKSQDIACIFREVAQLLEIKGDNPFRIRAYEKAADIVEGLGDKLEVLAKEDKLTTISGIGEDLSSKIKEIIKTGSLKYYKELHKDIPSGVIDMLGVQGLGPKTVKLIYNKLKIDSIAKLEKAAKKGELAKLEGIREKTQENILKSVEFLKKGAKRTPYYEAFEIAQSFIKKLKTLKEVEKIEAAGSLRRKKETVRDIDILVVSKKPQAVMDKFTRPPLAARVLAKGESKSSVIAAGRNVQVDLRVVEEGSFGSALLYFTGSKEFNVKLRQLAVKKGYKINEYGVFSVKAKKEKPLASKTEEDIFSLMGMAYVPPELREDRGEIEAALKGKLPKFVELKDIKGDLHVHSQYSDGINTIEEIALAAKKRGYEYIGIADHSQSLKIARGLSIKEVREKIEEIKEVNKKIKGIRVLCATEVEIDSSGNIDYPHDILKEFDYVIAAIHTGFKQSKQQLTKRLVNACKNKYVNIIAHPTGILWGVRDAYELDLGQVIKACSDYKVALEINCHPQRLDLNDLGAMQAKSSGVKLSLDTDSHNVELLESMKLGINVARRAWLTKKDVINTMSLEELLKWVKK